MRIFFLICLHCTCGLYINKFPHVFKHADIILAHKRKEKTKDKTTYWAASILPNLSKIQKKIRHVSQVNVDSAKDIVLIIAC